MEGGWSNLADQRQRLETRSQENLRFSAAKKNSFIKVIRVFL